MPLKGEAVGRGRHPSAQIVGDVTSDRLVLSVRIRRYHFFWESKNRWEFQSDNIGGRPVSVCRRRRGISESDHPAGLYRLVDPSLQRLPLGNRQLSRRGAPYHVYKARDNGRSTSGMVTLGQRILEVLTADIVFQQLQPTESVHAQPHGPNSRPYDNAGGTIGEVSRSGQQPFAHRTVYHGCKQQPHRTVEIPLPARNLFKELISTQDRGGLCIWVASCLHLQDIANCKRGWIDTFGECARRTFMECSVRTPSPSHGAFHDGRCRLLDM